MRVRPAPGDVPLLAGDAPAGGPLDRLAAPPRRIPRAPRSRPGAAPRASAGLPGRTRVERRHRLLWPQHAAGDAGLRRPDGGVDGPPPGLAHRRVEGCLPAELAHPVGPIRPHHPEHRARPSGVRALGAEERRRGQRAAPAQAGSPQVGGLATAEPPRAAVDRAPPTGAAPLHPLRGAGLGAGTGGGGGAGAAGVLAGPERDRHVQGAPIPRGRREPHAASGGRHRP